MRVWRLSKAKFAGSAFSGEGARLFEGRWNFAGVPMLYTSTSLALAAIEFFVYLDPSAAPDDLVSAQAKIPDALRRDKVAIEQLPSDWRRIDNRNLQQLGTDWARSKKSVALGVPSAAMEGEWNILLNPAHADFAKVEISPPKQFRYDGRMFR